MSTTESNIPRSDSLQYKLALGALGVVFGDIGTSPLYALRIALHGLPITELNVLGILSLIFWSLILIISIKYLIIVFKADNHGEGGILALLALLNQKYVNNRFFYIVAIFGAGLLIGDGMLTPAISVVSAMEGVIVISPNLKPYVFPISCIILITLFLIQQKGTAILGGAFGPIIFIWFIAIAWVGLVQLIDNPQVIKAISPYYAAHFLFANGWHGYFALGGVFLVVTGGEALYADLGHFGKNPIRLSWFLIVLPCLVLNYFGQAAYLLMHPNAIENPFYFIVPQWCFVPFIIIATLATIIASQAVIAATFSLTRQAVLLGLFPRIDIKQTSNYYGQIYIPQINFFLLVGTLLLIFTFRDSEGLAHAYGIAVNMHMLMITILVSFAAYAIWNWSLLKTTVIFTIFLIIDLLFLGANFNKFITGGWMPLAFAGIIGIVMHTWDSGLTYLKDTFYAHEPELKKVMKQLHYKCLHIIPGVTSIFITDVYDNSGGSFLHFLKLIQTVPENILIISYTIENIPTVGYNKRYEIIHLDNNVMQIILHYGFKDTISIPQALYTAIDRGLIPFPMDIEKAAYFIDIPNIIATKKKNTLTFHWQDQLFAFFMRNYSAHLNIEFYQIPYNRTVGIGSYYDL